MHLAECIRYQAVAADLHIACTQHKHTTCGLGQDGTLCCWVAMDLVKIEFDIVLAVCWADAYLPFVAFKTPLYHV